jgi:anti-sigma regulatory factor (Ser/Thr protein kinase)
MRYRLPGFRVTREGWGSGPDEIAIHEDMTEPVSETFPALPSALYEIRKFVRREAEAAGLPPDSINDLVLAVSEACANAVLHSGSEDIEVTWVPSDDCVEVVIRDRGVFIRRVPIPELDKTRGHGIPLMMALMDEVGVSEGTDRRPGTTVRLVKCRNW